MSCFSSDPVSYKLYYFNGKGRAEVIRLILSAAGKEFQDIRFEFDKWPEHKPKTPQGMLPYIEFDDVTLPQSNAINRYLAEKYGMFGKNLWERTMIDVIYETGLDLREKMVEAMFEKDEGKKAELFDKLGSEIVPKYLGLFDGFLDKKTNGSVFFVGNSVTLADLLVFHLLDGLLQKTPTLLDNHPKLKKNHEKVAEIPGIKKWLEKRPSTEF